MGLELTPEEVRVLGTLIEKQRSTPDYYPMTINGLRAACNQKTNREPVTDYNEEQVEATLDALQRRDLVRRIVESGGGARATRWGHRLNAALDLDDAQISLLAVLMLRGPQTVGELRSRSERLYSFGSLEDVDQTLTGMAHPADEDGGDEAATVVRLPRQPGTKEPRWMHRLGVGSAEPGSAGAHAHEAEAPITRVIGTADAGAGASAEALDRIAALEDEVTSLRGELARLERAFEDFRRQFE